MLSSIEYNKKQKKQQTELSGLSNLLNLINSSIKPIIQIKDI